MGALKRVLTVSMLVVSLALTFSCREKTPSEELREVFSLLDLDRPGLESVKAACDGARWNEAADALLEYYRNRQGVYMPGQDDSREASEKDMLWADDALRHTFHVLEEPVWNYGKDIDWQYWPVKNIEMRVQLHRQGWWTSLGRAYRSTGKEKYAREYVAEFRDWVKKNPYKPFGIDQGGTVSSGAIGVDSPNECFAWRPLEVGIRLLRWGLQFDLFLNSKNFTPEFLLEFLRSYHRNATVLMGSFSPEGNHLIHQSSGAVRAGICFPEFRDAESWLEAGVKNLNAEIKRQSFPDGCHFELDPGYHIGFVESYDDAIQVAVKNGRTDLFPKECLEQLVRMTRYYLDYCYPDGTHPCFSDARRHDDLADSVLLADVSRYLDTVEAKQITDVPAYKSSGHPDTGFYCFRNGWTDDSIIMPIKATERGAWHAQPDFGTFELWAYGRKLMPDAGSYTYSGDAGIEKERAYFKATARHNALTLDDRNYDAPHPKVLAWRPEGNNQLLCVQHEAYEGLTRRRSIEFTAEEYFTVTDEVWGPASGRLTLRNCLGPGSVEETAPGEYVYTDGDAGLRISVSGPAGSKLGIASDWFSEAMHERALRPVIRLDVERAPGSGVQRFVTVLRPFANNQNSIMDKNEEKLIKPDGFVLEHPAIDVADPVAVAAWWCENLGFTITRQKDDETHTTFIVDASGRVAIEMYRARTQPVAPDYASMDPLTLHFGFTSKDVDADIERLTKAGATLVVHEKSPGFDGAMMRDPFGIPIQFVKREKSVLLK